MPWKKEITETRPEKEQKHVEEREREGERGERRGEKGERRGEFGVCGRKPLNSKCMINVVGLNIDMIRLSSCQFPSSRQKKQKRGDQYNNENCV